MVNSNNITLKQAGLWVSLFCLSLLSACSRNSKVIASVNDQILNEDDLFLITQFYDIESDDSTAIKQIIQSWVNRKLYAEELKKTSPEKFEEVNLRADAFTGDLARTEVERTFVSGNIDSTVTEKQLQEYYDVHKDEFILHDYIVKALYLKIPKTVDFKKEKIQNIFQLKNKNDLDLISGFARLNAEQFYFDDSTWIYFSELSKDIPLTKYNIDNVVLNRTKTYFSDDEHTYFLNIIDYKLKDEAPPLDFLANQIRTIILANRSQELLEQNKSQLLKELHNKHEVNINY